MDVYLEENMFTCTNILVSEVSIFILSINLLLYIDGLNNMFFAHPS